MASRSFSKIFQYVIREVVPHDAVNAEGVAYADASDEQRAAGGFAKDGIVYAADVPVQVTAWISEDTGELQATVAYGTEGASECVIANRYEPEEPQPAEEPPNEQVGPQDDQQAEQGLRDPWVRYGKLVRAGDPLAVGVIALAALAAVAALALAARALRRRRE